MFSVLQIRRPVLAAVCLAVAIAAQMAVFGAVRGESPGDILLEMAVAVIAGSVVGAAVNQRMRPEGLAALSAAQLRHVIRWVRRGEVVDDRVIAEAVIEYARRQEGSAPLAGACMAVLGFSAMTFGVARPAGLESTLIAVGLAGAGVVFLADQRAARRRRRAAVASARSVLGEH